MSRTATSLRVKWQKMAREVQNYLAERKSAFAKPVNGATDVVMDAFAIKLYCARASRKYADVNGNDVFAQPFRYQDAARFLSTHPKFRGRS